MNNSPVDAIVLGGIDSFLPARGADKQFLRAVNEQVRQAISDGDLHQLESIGKSILGINQVTGIAFSEYIYTLSACWKDLKQTQDFYQWAEDRFGKVKKTIDDHNRIWSMFVSGDIEKSSVEKLKTHPIRNLIPIANLWNQGYEVSDFQWEQIANAPDTSSVNKLIKEIKGSEDKSGTLRLEWAVEQDVIVGWVDGKPHSIYLSYDKNDPVVEKMKSRLFKREGILEK